MCFFFVLYQSVVVPFRICFEVEATGFLFYLETTIDAAFLIDIRKSLFLLNADSLTLPAVISFNTGFYD